MGIFQKAVRAAKTFARRLRLSRKARRLQSEICLAYAEMEYNPERRMVYMGEYIPHLTRQLADTHAQLRGLPRVPTLALGNVHRRLV